MLWARWSKISIRHLASIHKVFLQIGKMCRLIVYFEYRFNFYINTRYCSFIDLRMIFTQINILWQMNRIEKAPNLSSNLRTVTQTPSMHALEHFDDFYKKVYKNDWPSIRCALLSKSKFCAVLNGFADTVWMTKFLLQRYIFYSF